MNKARRCFARTLPLDDPGREDIAIPEVSDLLWDGTSWIVLIDGWISQQDTQLSFFGQGRVYGAHSTVKLFKNRSIPLCEGLSGVVPGLSLQERRKRSRP